MLKESSLSQTVFWLLPWLLLIVAICLYVWHALYYGSWINDDAGISFTYARNLANDFGLVLSPGEERVEGYSNPLWTFVLSLFFKLNFFDPVVIPKALGVLFTVISFYLIYRLSQQIFADERSILHAIPPLLLATNTSFVAWSISGLENAFYVFLIILGIYLYLAELESASRFPFSSPVLFLVAITRPEGVIYFVAAFIHKTLTAAIRKKGEQILLWMGLFIIPFFIYHAWHYQYFADFFPNTYYAKRVAGSIISRFQNCILNFNSPGWQYVRKAFGQYNLTFIFIPCSLATILYFRRFFLKLSFLFLFVGMSIFYPLYVRGDWMMEFRILSPFFPLAYLVIGGGLFALWQFLSTKKRLLCTLLSYCSLVLIILVLGALLVYPNINFTKRAKGDPTVPFSNAVSAGKKFKTLANEAFIRNASLLHPDIGGTSYASGLKIIDLAGLADVHIGKYHYRNEYFGDYIFRGKKPTFIHTRGTWSRASQIHKYTELKRDYLPLWESFNQDYKTVDGDYVRKDVFIVNDSPIKDRVYRKLNEQVELLGYVLDADIALPGRKRHITLFWKALKSGNSKGAKYKYFITFDKKGGCNDKGKRLYALNLFKDSSMEKGEMISSGGERTKDISHSGVYSWKATKKWDGPENPEGFEIYEGEYYTVSAWVKNTGTNAVTIYSFSNDPQGGTTYGAKLGKVPPSSNWTRLSATIKSDKTFENLTVRVEVDKNTQDGAVYLDNVQIEYGQTLSKWKPYPDNMFSFVYGWYPPNKWRKGEIIGEEHDIRIPENIQTGSYSLVLGLIKNGRCVNEITLGSISISKEEILKKAEDYFQSYQVALKHRKFEKALNLIRKALILKPKDKIFQNALEVGEINAVHTYVDKARILLRKEKYEEAVGTLQKAKSIDRFDDEVLRLSSKISGYYYKQGELYRKKKAWRKAFEFYQKALSLSSSNAWARKRMETLRPYIRSGATKADS